MPPGFCDVDERLAQLSKLGDPLEHLGCTIPWEEFRALLQTVHVKERKCNAGRKPYDPVLMFKVLILQCERLKRLGLVERLFNRFADVLEAQGYLAKQGQIIDASIVKAPIQRNRRQENATIKRSEEPEDWPVNKRRQKDTQARWTKKHGKSHYGYKNHISVDVPYKLIRTYAITPANVHDSLVFDRVLDVENAAPQVWADSAYRSEGTEAALTAAGFHITFTRKANVTLR